MEYLSYKLSFILDGDLVGEREQLLMTEQGVPKKEEGDRIQSKAFLKECSANAVGLLFRNRVSIPS